MAHLTVSLLESIGRTLYGDRYQSELARDLGITDRTMRRWVAGTFRPEDADDMLS